VKDGEGKTAVQPIGECGAIALLRRWGKGIVEAEVRFIFT